MNEPFDLAAIIKETAIGLARAQAAGVTAGCQLTEQRYGRGCRALRLAFEAAQMDPQAKIPTVLSTTILALLALHHEDEVNLYATTQTGRDLGKDMPDWERQMRQGAADPATSR